MRDWIREQIESMLVLLGICSALGALEYVTFTVLGID